MAQTASKSVKPDLDEISSQLETLKGDVAKLTELLSAEAKGSVEALKEKAAQTAEDTAAQVSDTARDAMDQMEATVRAQPGLSVGIATGVGFLLGLLLARR